LIWILVFGAAFWLGLLVILGLMAELNLIIIDGTTSKPVRAVLCLVVGPELFIMYVDSLPKVVEQYGVSILQLSADTTIYLEFCFPLESPDLFDALHILSSCAGDLVDWFA